MEEEIKAVGECYPPNSWYYRTGPNQTKTTFFGRGLSILSDLTPDRKLKIIADSSIPSTTETGNQHYLVRALEAGHLDVVPDLFVITFERSQHVDFSYPLTNVDTVIISRTNTVVPGLIFNGAFDTISYLLYILSLSIMILLMGLVIKYKVGKVDPGELIVQCTGNIFNQPLPEKYMKYRYALSDSYLNFQNWSANGLYHHV